MRAPRGFSFVRARAALIFPALFLDLLTLAFRDLMILAKVEASTLSTERHRRKQELDSLLIDC